MFRWFSESELLRQLHVKNKCGSVILGRWNNLDSGDRACNPSALGRSMLLTADIPGRSIHTSMVYRAKNLLKKFLNTSKKKSWYNSPQQGSTMRAPRQQDQQSRHRFRILNSLIFKAVSDLLQSAQVSRDLQRYSPEISKVSLVPDFSSCHVFWKSSGESERDQLVQRALDRNGPSIRYLIMSQQIMGGVPPLVFLKDKQLAIMEEVDRLLLLADTGPDLPEIFPDDRHSPLPAVDGAAGSSSVHPSLFGVDHEVLNRQIIEWRLSTGERHHMPPEFTQEQLAVLEQHRKQQIIRKRKKKTLSLDDGVTPKQLLLPQHINITPQFHSERQESEEDGAFKQEEAQLLQLMSEKEMV